MSKSQVYRDQFMRDPCLRPLKTPILEPSMIEFLASDGITDEEKIFHMGYYTDSVESSECDCIPQDGVYVNEIKIEHIENILNGDVDSYKVSEKFTGLKEVFTWGCDERGTLRVPYRFREAPIVEGKKPPIEARYVKCKPHLIVNPDFIVHDLFCSDHLGMIQRESFWILFASDPLSGVHSTDVNLAVERSNARDMHRKRTKNSPEQSDHTWIRWYRNELGEKVKIDVVAVSLGEHNISVIDDLGHLYVCGTYYLGDSVVGCPYLEDNFKIDTDGLSFMKMLYTGAKKVVSGPNHTAALIQEQGNIPKLLMWGSDPRLLNMKDPFVNPMIPRLCSSEDLGFSSKYIVDVFAVPCGFFVVGTDGTNWMLRAFGFGRKGQLGIHKESPDEIETKSVATIRRLVKDSWARYRPFQYDREVEVPFRIGRGKSTPTNIISIVGNKDVTFILTNKGNLYASGDTRYTGTQMEEPHQYRFRKVKFPGEVFVTSVGCGSHFAIVSDSLFDVWVWGDGTAGYLIPSEFRHVKYPTRLSPALFQARPILKVVASDVVLYALAGPIPRKKKVKECQVTQKRHKTD